MVGNSSPLTSPLVGVSSTGVRSPVEPVRTVVLSLPRGTVALE
ncbi:hypothetical protein ACFFX0_19175 [Citricoccus parietis]|uniref:Uncharacterized protein n=1 Tax=Citricoccus parietis TaxID=592307 RepID=A0ABV5G3H7_9MICC